MPDLPRNQRYKNLSSAAFDLGRSIQRFKKQKQPKVTKSSREVPTKKLSNINRAINKYQGGENYLRGLGQITTPYGGSTRYESYHPGVDIAARTGTPLRSLTEGRVIGSRTGMGQTPSTPSFGNYILVKTPDNRYVRYSHLEDNWVPMGTEVKSGMPLGTIGKSGSTYSRYGAAGDPSHLDLRIWETYNDMKQYLDPFEYL